MELKEVYKEMAKKVDAWHRCVKTENDEWAEKHEEAIEELINELPHGSGLDSSWHLNFEKSSGEKLVLSMDFHPLNENGFYESWISFTLVVIGSLMSGLRLAIVGNFGKRQDVKDYLYDILQ